MGLPQIDLAFSPRRRWYACGFQPGIISESKMALTLKSAADTSIPELAALFNLAFTGYIGGNVSFDTNGFHALLCRENIDLTLSRLLMRDDAPVGIGLISRQGWTSRVAGMGIVPEAQSQGMGTWFLEQIVNGAKARGEHAMVLEAYEQNTAALRLYLRIGFTIVQRLYGYTGQGLSGVPATELKEVDIYEVGKLIVEHGEASLPWQVSGTSIARLGSPYRAFQLHEAYAVISESSSENIAMRALFVSPQYRRQGHATRLLHALVARYPDRKLSIPPLCPEAYGENFFEKRGFVRAQLNQVQMECALVN
jgi:ribosomal protein S18 acetylase RimI-like enzyme